MESRYPEKTGRPDSFLLVTQPLTYPEPTFVTRNGTTPLKSNFYRGVHTLQRFGAILPKLSPSNRDASGRGEYFRYGGAILRPPLPGEGVPIRATS